uniref:Small membrane A-kinase anchor protein n=1 Tax=Electrophorus electricus TaxID=8005 RepID=A0A4W4HJK4_ELEEL
MGCIKSRYSDAVQSSSSVEKVDGKPGRERGEKAVLVYAETGSVEVSSRVSPVLLDYAQRLSEEIVARAVQQWVEVDSRYSDIPYIEKKCGLDTFL